MLLCVVNPSTLAHRRKDVNCHRCERAFRRIPSSQRRIRIGDVWYHMDLILFHRLLRHLLSVDNSKKELPWDRSVSDTH